MHLMTYLKVDKRVLIDTWWNVNFIRKSSNYKNGNVLIDTWWNVNTTSFIMSTNNHFRFNRYMVECESFFYATLLAVYMGFNRYMVECEYGSCRPQV